MTNDDMDDLRNAIFIKPGDTAEAPTALVKPIASQGAFPPRQRMILAMLLLVDVAIVCFGILIATGKMALPF
jgi:hypothetical protein